MKRIEEFVKQLHTSIRNYWTKQSSPCVTQLCGKSGVGKTTLAQMLMYGKVSQENYVELTAASAIPNKEIKSPQILRY